MEKISPPVRILAVVLVLVGAAGMLMMRTMGPSAEPVAVPPSAQTPAKAQPVEAAPKPAQTAKTGAKPVQPAKKAAATPAQPAAKPKPKALNAPKPTIRPTGFPTVVDRALAEHEVVVISLVVPGARVDELAAAEAEAGAKLGGAGFLALNVLNEDVARALLTKLDLIEDPSVLVLRRSGDVALELAGFVDRETVAQAAANAAA
jgi:hypothetical protein